MLRIYAAALLQTLISAGTYLVAKATMRELTPFEVAWLRFVGAALIYAMLFASSGRALLPPRGMRGRLVLLGLVGLVLNQGLFLSGLARSTPTHAAILYALTPTVVLLEGRIFLGERISGPKVIGIVCAFAGVTLVLLERGLQAASVALVGDLLILGAVFCWATYTVLTRPVARQCGSLQTTGWALMAGGLISLPVTPWAVGELGATGSVSAAAWLGIAFLVVFTSVVSYLLWGYALGRLEASKVAVFSNLQPVATALLSWVLLGEGVSLTAALGGLLVIAGVTATQRG